MKQLLPLFLFILLFFSIHAGEYTGEIRHAGERNPSGKRLELYILVNGRTVYPVQSASKGQQNFRTGDQFLFRYRNGDQIRIILYRKSLFGTEILLDAGSSSDDVISELFSKRMKTSQAEVELGLVIPEGKYRISLEESEISPEDAVFCGATEKNDPFKRRAAELLIQLQETKNHSERLRLLKQESFAELARYAVNSIEKLDHRIVVLQNKKKIFDSWAHGLRKTGRHVTWKNAAFDLNWKQGDRLEVLFLDADLMDDDLIFRRMTNTPGSIQMLKGRVSGGILSNSGIIFSAKKIDQ